MNLGSYLKSAPLGPLGPSGPCLLSTSSPLLLASLIFFFQIKEKYIARAKGLKGPKGVIYQSPDKIDRERREDR